MTALMMVRSRGLLTALLLTTMAATATTAQAPTRVSAKVDVLVNADAMELSDVGGTVMLRSGELVLTQYREGHVLIISPDGKVQKLGRPGEGPGEFRSPTVTGTIGDTLWVGDVRLRRVTFFGPDLKVVRTAQYPAAGAAVLSGSRQERSIWLALLPEAWHPGGFMLATGIYDDKGVRPEWIEAGDWGGSPVIRLAPDGSMQKVAAWSSVSSCSADVPVAGGSTIVRIPFCHPSPRHIAADGSRIAMVDPLGTARGVARYRVRVLSGMGDPLIVRNIELPTVGIPAAVRDSAKRTASDNGRIVGAGFDEAMRRVPEHYPPVERILNGNDGTTWIEVRGSSGREWWMLDVRGEPALSVVVPPSVRLVTAERGRLHGIDTDDDGLMRVVRITPGSR